MDRQRVRLFRETCEFTPERPRVEPSKRWVLLIATALAIFGINASANNLERLPPQAIGEVFRAYYSLDPAIFDAYFTTTIWPLTSNEHGDMAFAYLQGNVGIGAIVWSNPWSSSTPNASAVGAMWGNILERWQLLTSDPVFWNSYPIQSQQVIPFATVNPPHLGSRSREGGEYLRLYGEIAIFSSASGGVRVVYDPFQDWRGLGGFDVIGWPTSDEYAPNDGLCDLRQDFTFAHACLKVPGAWEFRAPDGRRL